MQVAVAATQAQWLSATREQVAALPGEAYPHRDLGFDLARSVAPSCKEPKTDIVTLGSAVLPLDQLAVGVDRPLLRAQPACSTPLKQ